MSKHWESFIDWNIFGLKDKSRFVVKYAFKLVMSYTMCIIDCKKDELEFWWMKNFVTLFLSQIAILYNPYSNRMSFKSDVLDLWYV